MVTNPMDNQSLYHTLLRDPTRRKTIETLGEQNKMGFKELKQLLEVGFEFVCEKDSFLYFRKRK